MTAMSQQRNRGTRAFAVATDRMPWGNSAYDKPDLLEFSCPDCNLPFRVPRMAGMGVPYHLIGGGIAEIGCAASFAKLKFLKDGEIEFDYDDDEIGDPES